MQILRKLLWTLYDLEITLNVNTKEIVTHNL